MSYIVPFRVAKSDCIFCRISRGEIAAKILFSDDDVVAFRDANPQAPEHILVIPRRHVANLTDADAATIGRLGAASARAAQETGLTKKGFRVVVNEGDDAGQAVDHLHFHVLGGRRLHWPPG